MCSSTTFSSSRRRLHLAKPSGAGERVSAINFASAAPSKIRGRAELGLYLRVNTALQSTSPSSTRVTALTPPIAERSGCRGQRQRQSGRGALPGLRQHAKRTRAAQIGRAPYVRKHASWLNMVEIEIGLYGSSSIDASPSANSSQRSQPGNDSVMLPEPAIKWMFTTEKARAKMGRCLPRPADPTKFPS